MNLLFRNIVDHKCYLSRSSCISALAIACIGQLLPSSAFAQDSATSGYTAETVGELALGSEGAAEELASTSEGGGGEIALEGESAAAEAEGIVVTGTRVSRDGYQAPTPLNVLGAEDIKAEAPANISDFVNTLPSVRGSTTASQSSGALSNGEAGIAALNLRGLGTGRTLVLFDGQRSVVSAGTGVVDTNTFPQALISRVEVVTGGASSAYGSDAIGGVVNFILDRKYTGLKGSADYGITTHGDAGNYRLTLTGGLPFADDRGHLLVSGEVFHQDGIFDRTRKWGRKGYFAMRNPDTSPGAPFYIVDNNIGISSYTPGGLITSGPLRGTYFGQGGSVNQLNFGEVSGQWMRGGDWEYTTSGMLGTNSLQAEEDRQSIFGRGSFEVTDNIEVFAQASYTRYEGLSYYINPTTTGIVIQRDNAFLPAAVGAAMDANGLTSFTMGTSNVDMPASGSHNVRETQRYVIGADGDFTALDLGFTWNAYYQKGITDSREQLTDTYNIQRLTWATDAVRNASGNIVCRSAAAQADGCVPLNRFGSGVANSDGLAYVMGRPLRTQTFTQDVGALSFSTNDIPGWAGNISLAFGVEARKEKIDGDVDPIYQSGWKYGNYRVTKGSYDVKEAFVEAVVPVFDGLELNGAFRYTDYSVSGSVNTWKIGATFQPIADLRFRGYMSKDIRAPNLSELFATGIGRTNTVAINGVPMQFVQALMGSTELKPETADSFGIGAIATPSFIPGLSLSVDYYNIKIEDVISSLTAEQTVAYCYDNNVQRYCDNIHFDNDGLLQSIDLYYENLNSMKAQGIDVEASYRMAADVIFPESLGEFAFRAMATHYIENRTDNGVTAIDQAGALTGFAAGTPDWVYRLTASYKDDNVLLSLIGRGVSSGVIRNDYTECASNCPTLAPPYYTINDNSVPGAFFLDASINYTWSLANNNEVELFFLVKNIFDKDPVLVSDPMYIGAENTAGYPQTNRMLYDVLGRSFRVGVRFAI
jgi:iron complex outermembrane recepter protein